MKNFFLAFLCVLTTTFISAQVADLPLTCSEFKPLRQTLDVKLNAQLKQIIQSHPKWKKLAKKKRLCVGLVDLSNAEVPKFAHINGDHMMYAASLPKIAILLAAVDAIDKGQLLLTPEIEDMMQRMINVSSNTAATSLIDLVGYDKIAKTLQDDKYKLYDSEGLGGLWVGKRYGSGGGRNPDPIKGLSHAATATQVCRFYYLLSYGKLINCARSEQMLGYLKDPHLHHKFVNTLDKIDPDADLYRKSGTWRTYHTDSVLVNGDDWRTYILVALVDDKGGEQIVRDLILEVDNLLKKQNKIRAERI